MSEPLRLAYVCAFGSVHARGLIKHFAQRPENFCVTVFSTGSAEPMDGVELIVLADASALERAKANRFAGLLYAGLYWLLDRFPRLYEYMRITKELRDLPTLEAKLDELSKGRSFDLVHGLRTLPEGVLARSLAKRTQAFLALTSWGQDFAVWARGHAESKRLTEELVRSLSLFFPDNGRDLSIAVAELGFDPAVPHQVMPAVGGLDVPQLEQLAASAPRAAFDGTPVFLSMRGYDNMYVKTSLAVAALPLILAHYPQALLIADGPSGHPGLIRLRNQAEELGISHRVRFVHYSRAELFRAMEAADVLLSVTSNDGLPMSLLEGFYFGMVPVSYRLESLSPPLRQGENGVLFGALTPQAVASAAIEAVALAAATPRTNRLMANRAMLSEGFDRDHNLEQMAELYRVALSPSDASQNRSSAGVPSMARSMTRR